MSTYTVAAEPLPEIDLQRCDGCGACVRVCPTGVLALVQGWPAIVQADRCDYCGRCEAACPRQAIACPFVVVLAPAATTAGAQAARASE
jgi:ferredoxin